MTTIIILPINDAKLPMIETAPDVPALTTLNEVISLGLLEENIPSSVPHVSAVAAATAAK